MANEIDVQIHKYRMALEHFYANARNALAAGNTTELHGTFKVDDKIFIGGIWEGSEVVGRIDAAMRGPRVPAKTRKKADNGQD